MAHHFKRPELEESEIALRAACDAVHEASQQLKNAAANLSQSGTPPSNMSSQRSRAPRGGVRGGPHESGEEAQLWAEIREQLEKIKKHEDRAKDLSTQIFSMETRMKTQQDAGMSESHRRLQFFL